MQTNNLHMFPVTPEIGIDRKKDIENRFKALQRIDPKIRYQIRLGDDDFKVFVKIYTKGEYDSYREFPIKYFDPNEHVRDLKTVLNKDSDDGTPELDEPATNEWSNVLNKHTRRRFMKQKKELNRFISDTQIIEFLHDYLKGTKVSPWGHFLSKSAEDTLMDHQNQEDQNGAAAAGSSGTC